MKNSKAKDGPRSLQMPSSHIYLTYPAFHMEIFPLITSRECDRTEESRNKCMSNTATWQQTVHQQPCSIRRASHRFPQHRREFSFGFWDNLAERVCHSRDQTTTLFTEGTSLTQWERMTSMIRDVRCGEEVSLICSLGKKESNNGTAAPAPHKDTRVGTHTHTQAVQRPRFFFLIKQDHS